MIEPSSKDALLEELKHLAEPDRRRVLEYARSLAERIPHGTTGKALLAFAGSLPESDAVEIAAAIDNGCEKVNRGAW